MAGFISIFFEIGNPFKPISSEVDQPVAMLVAVGAGAVVSELLGMGIEQHDPVNKFWEVYGERMRNVFPEMAGCAATITPQIMEHGIITVGGMLTLSVGEMEECITNGGGRAKWTKGVMNLLGRSTSQCGNISTQSRMIPPPSASLMSLASSSSTDEEHKKDQAYKPAYPNDKLGVRLLQNGTLDACIIPKERLLAAVTETKDPHLNTLSYNDCKAVMAVVFAFIFTKYGNVGGCGTLFDALEKQLDLKHGGLFARPHGKTSFRDKIVNRFKTGRRAGQTLELDQSQADETCEDGMQIMRMGMHIKIKKEAPTWPKSQWGEALERENLSENVSNQAARPASKVYPEDEQIYQNSDYEDIANEEGERVILEPGAKHSLRLPTISTTSLKASWKDQHHLSTAAARKDHHLSTAAPRCLRLALGCLLQVFVRPYTPNHLCQLRWQLSPMTMILLRTMYPSQSVRVS